MYKVFKYELNFNDSERGAEVKLPKYSKVLKVALKSQIFYLWAIVNAEEKAFESRVFQLFGTGWSIEKRSNLIFIDTIFDNSFVWHIFEVDEEAWVRRTPSAF